MSSLFSRKAANDVTIFGVTVVDMSVCMLLFSNEI